MFCRGLFTKVITYSDSQTKSKQCVYNQAEALFDDGDYSGAKAMYASIDYLDSQDKAKESAYHEADVLYQEKKYADAETIFLSVPGYNDSDDRGKDCHLQQGKVLMNSGDYQGALTFFESVDYENSSTLAAKCHYEIGLALHFSGNTDAAIAEYAFAVSLQEAKEAISSAAKDYLVINEYEKAIQALWLIREQDNARTSLINIGNIKCNNNELALGCLAYCAIGESNLIELHNIVPQLSFELFEEQIKVCKLLREEMSFGNFVYYVLGNVALEEQKYDLAISAFKSAGQFGKANDMLEESLYCKADYLMNDKNYSEAYAIFGTIKHYKDTENKLKEIQYIFANEYEKKGFIKKAIAAYKKLGTFSDSSKKVYELASYLEKQDLYVFQDDSKYGFCNKYGEIQIESKWKSVGHFIDGIAYVENSSGLYGAINKTGEYVIDCKYKRITISDGGYIVATDSNYNSEVYDSSGKLLLPNDTRINVNADGEGGLVFIKGKDTYYFDYSTQKTTIYYDRPSTTSAFHEGLLNVWGVFIDKEGNEVLEIFGPKYNVMGHDFHDGLVVVYDGDSKKQGYADKNGSIVIPCTWDDAYDFHEGIARVGNYNTGYGYIDKSGRVVTDCQFEAANDFNEGMARVRVNEKYGFVNQTGKLAIDAIYDFASQYYNGLALVEKNGERYYIDYEGQTVIPYNYNELMQLADSMFDKTIP